MRFVRSFQRSETLDPVPGDIVLLHAATTFTIADIRCAVPGVSDNTIRLVLTDLKSQGHIASDGTGRGATWRRV